jgi:hypothetical protein
LFAHCLHNFIFHFWGFIHCFLFKMTTEFLCMFVLLLHNVAQLIVRFICMLCVFVWRVLFGFCQNVFLFDVCVRMKDKIIIVYALMYVHTVFMYLFLCLYTLWERSGDKVAFVCHLVLPSYFLVSRYVAVFCSSS